MNPEEIKIKALNPIVLVGYSGHAYVVCDILNDSNTEIYGYCEKTEKSNNPYKIKFLGSERDQHELLKSGNVDVFVAVGENKIRQTIMNTLLDLECNLSTIVHKSAFLSPTSKIGKGTLLGINSIINAYTKIGNGVICNTGSIIEHECILHDFVHIAPGAVLCGNVEVGERSFIGAGSVVKQGVKIGKDVLVGAGSVIIRDVPDNTRVVGNPQREI